jgi:YVTN family beta-propeller protein
MISSQRTLWAVLFVSICLVLISGCGDTFRPTIITQPQPQGNPAALGQAIVLSANPAGNGSDTHVDVSGDTNVGVVTVGSNPVFLGKGTGRAFVIDQSTVAGVPSSLTLYIALLPQQSTINTITLPVTAIAPVAGANGNNGTLYIANSGSNDVTFIPSTNNVAAGSIPVGTNPVAVAGGATTLAKVYVVNKGDNSVSSISTIDNTVQTTIKVGAQPIWAVMSTDGLTVFVVNQGDGTVSVIDTGSDAVVGTIPVGTSPNFAFYEPHLKRVYVSNTGSNTISVIKADLVSSGTQPTKLADIAISGPAVSVTALSDGTRAYAALGACPAGTNHTNLLSTLLPGGCTGSTVSVIDALALRESKVIPVGNGAVSIDAADDASKVYVANAHDGTISIIRTATDTELSNTAGQPQRMGSPLQNISCADPAVCPATPQIPFMVRAFP